jgi:hypothetical protein
LTYLLSVTSEGLHRLFALHFYGRSLFIQRLLPLLHAAPSGTLKRVLSIASGSYEGIIQMHDLPALTIPLSQLRGHAASTMTLVFQQLANENPDVSFITDHPGTVVTPSLQQIPGILGLIARATIFLIGRWITVPLSESAERHVFLATSDSFKAKSGEAKGVPLVNGLEIHGGIDGEKGSGLYSVNWNCEGPSETAIKLLKDYNANGTADKVWKHCQSELERLVSEP